MPTRTLTCPACNSNIPIAVDESLRKVVNVPNYCPSCGIPIQKRCPSCNRSFSKLARFCHDCGAEVHPPRNHSSTPRHQLPSSSAHLLKRLRQDAQDSVKFVREALLVIVRLNPPNLAAHRFCEIVAPITESMPRSNVATLVGQALTEAQGVLDDNALEEWRGIASGIVGEIVAATRKSLDTTLPEWRQFISHPWIDNPDVNALWIRAKLESAINANISDVSIIREKYTQMCEFYPRYQKIMSRTGVWDYVLGFAAGVLGGTLGAVGAQVWDDWRNKSDQDFMQSFTSAVDQFTQGAFAFMQNTEAGVTPIVEQVVSEQLVHCEAVVDGLDSVAREGGNIESVFHALHFPDENVIDDDGRQFLELIIGNLRQQGLSSDSEHNIREMCGLNGGK